ncbi:immunity protein YezG family protein, partial [Bacillus subtilis]
METTKMEQLYQKIAEKINDMIPSEWMRVTLYAEILDDPREVYFFF